MKFHHTVLTHVREGWKRHKKTILITTGVSALVVVIVVGGSYAYAKVYEGKIYPNVSIGTVPVGGMTKAEASEAIQAAYNSMLDRGLPVRLVEDDRLSVIDLRASGSTDPDLVYDLISVNVDQATIASEEIGRRTGNVFIDTFESLLLLAQPHNIEPEFTIAHDKITDALENEFSNVEVEAEYTDYIIEFDEEEISIEIVEGSEGKMLDTDAVSEAMKRDVLDFELEEQILALTETHNVVSEDEAEALLADVEAAIDAAPYNLTYTSDLQREYEWEIDEDAVTEWIYPTRNETGSVTLALDAGAMEEFLAEIHEDVDVEPQNARFQVEGDRVVEFKGSLDGISLDEEATLIELNDSLGEEEVELAISVERVEPKISTDSVNSLGIKEVVGAGVSNFSGSPSNRVSNIQHGADKLNGLLIAPDEEFSLVEALKPFTVADGWLPELVIKGDEIKPEVGGGACQFGTTLFRAAMNSGLDITQRRNHSLVVSYYNDPSNGNPGTDATIYDPAPDFRFVNDTGNYLLLTTDVNLETRDMTFTFWGTSDGRNGYYTPPQVLSWSGYGATVEKETDTLPPGVRQCQSPHAGAMTEFDYIVEYADGEVFEHTYTSTYRSLPRICLVGIGGDTDENIEQNPTGENTETEPEAEEPVEDATSEDEEPAEEPTIEE